ncbi:hypothetical protein B0H14DRAFT_700029 [Mycena olivaceomarginata]|nr:hypothetical protein B0H14DRAFT_700029 [Mycena olivaceomarginata]
MGDPSTSSESARKSKLSGNWEQVRRVLYEERGIDMVVHGSQSLATPAGPRRRERSSHGNRVGMGMGHRYDGLRMAVHRSSSSGTASIDGKEGPNAAFVDHRGTRRHYSLLLISQDVRYSPFVLRPSTFPRASLIARARAHISPSLRGCLPLHWIRSRCRYTSLSLASDSELADSDLGRAI